MPNTVPIGTSTRTTFPEKMIPSKASTLSFVVGGGTGAGSGEHAAAVGRVRNGPEVRVRKRRTIALVLSNSLPISEHPINDCVCGCKCLSLGVHDFNST